MRYMVYKCFLSVCSLPVHPLKRIIHWAKDFEEAQFINFFLIWIVLLLPCLRTLHLVLGPEDFLLCFLLNVYTYTIPYVLTLLSKFISHVLRVSAETNDTLEQITGKKLNKVIIYGYRRRKEKPTRVKHPGSSNSGTLLPPLVLMRQEGKQVLGPRRSSCSSESPHSRSCGLPVNPAGRELGEYIP